MKKRILTIVAVIALAIVTIIGLVACNPKEVSGFDIDLAKAIFEKEGIEVVTRKIDWSKKKLS